MAGLLPFPSDLLVFGWGFSSVAMLLTEILCSQDQQEHFDLVLTFERSVFNDVLEDLRERAEAENGAEPAHIINLEVRPPIFLM